MPSSRFFPLWFLVLGLFLTPTVAFPQGLEKVKIVYASRSLPFLSALIAREMNFYLRHGLDAELMQMAPRLAITALATNQVDYSMNIGSTIRAAMRRSLRRGSLRRKGMASGFW